MRSFDRTAVLGITLLVTTGALLPAHAGKLSWFDDAPFAGVGALGAPEARWRSLSDRQYTSFGLDLYRSQSAVVEEGYVDSGDATADMSNLRLYGEIESTQATRSASLVQNVGDVSLADASRRVNAFGVQWQHRLDAINRFAVSAEYGEGVSVYPSTLNTLDTRAAFSWNSQLPSRIRPSITGSVFLGDEMAREEIYRHLGRKYYGIALGGSLTLFQAHTPYVSFKIQKSIYDSAEDLQFVSSRSDDRSLLSAGWKWQVQRDLRLQAEASYGFGNATTPELYNPERSRIFFGTRFDFK